MCRRGDWNTPSWSPFYRDVLAKTGLHATEFPWKPAATRFSLRFVSIVALGMPIDHLAISSSIGLSAFWTSPKFGSNHVAILADLTMPSGAVETVETDLTALQLQPIMDLWI